MNNLVGNHLGKYELKRLLGQGGMAEVYEAFQPGTERLVAIKVLHGYGNQTPESIARFKREARSIAQLRHTNIIQVYDFDVDHDRYYMVMEYVRGGTLNAYLRQEGALSAQHALRVAIQLADGLDYAHARGVIHRDIKPANIIFADLEHQHPVLTDFGIARILSETAVTSDGRFMGSPAYLSPEVAMGRPADARSDIYGLGLCLYEMVTGRMPFTADGSTGLVAQHMIAPLPAPRQFNPDVHPALEMILDKALAKNREQRYQSANEFKLVLERIAESLNGHPIVIQPSVSLANVRPASGTTVQLPGENAPARSTTLPYETNPQYLSQSDSLPFDEPAIKSLPELNELEAETEPQPRRRRPLVAVVLLIGLVGLLGYLALSGNQTIAGDNATPTVMQPAAIEAANTEEPLAPTFTASATLTGTATVTSTLTATLTPTATASYTPSVTSTVDIPPVRENPYFRPSAVPSETPTITPTSTPRPPRPTQSSNTNPPSQPVTAPTSPSAGATNAPGSGDGASGGTGAGGGNPVGDVVDDVGDTVDEVTDPIEDLLDDILPPLPTICLLGC
jgi:serine/threonine protein kinase